MPNFVKKLTLVFKKLLTRCVLGAGFIVFLAVIWVCQELTKFKILRYVILFIGAKYMLSNALLYYVIIPERSQFCCYQDVVLMPQAHNSNHKKNSRTRFYIIILLVKLPKEHLPQNKILVELTCILSSLFLLENTDSIS